MAKIKSLVEELNCPLAPGDAAELVVAKICDRLDELDPEIAPKFDAYWFKVFVDLVLTTIEHCDEQNVAATLRDISKDPEGLRARVVRRKIALGLPVGAKNQLNDTERYNLADDAIEAGIAVVKDVELWAILWGHNTEWTPVIHVSKEPAAEPPAPEPVQLVSAPS